MARFTPLADGEVDSDAMDVSDTEEDDKDHGNDEDMEVANDEDDKSNDDDNIEEDSRNKEEIRTGVREGKKRENCIITDPKAMEPRAEEPPAATSAAIDAEDEPVVYFYGRTDLTRKLYQLPLSKADSWMGLRRYLGPLVSQTGRFKIYGPDDQQISEIFWKPCPKEGKTFSFIYSDLVFLTVLSTNSTAPEYSVFPMTVTERTRVHQLRGLIQWEMRRQRWTTPEKASDLELDVFLVLNERHCVARMKGQHFVSHYLQGKSEQLKIKVRNTEVALAGEMLWPEWNERMYWA